jgi:hypothetical protein
MTFLESSTLGLTALTAGANVQPEVLTRFFYNFTSERRDLLPDSPGSAQSL